MGKPVPPKGNEGHTGQDALVCVGKLVQVGGWLSEGGKMDEQLKRIIAAVDKALAEPLPKPDIPKADRKREEWEERGWCPMLHQRAW